MILLAALNVDNIYKCISVSYGVEFSQWKKYIEY